MTRTYLTSCSQSAKYYSCQVESTVGFNVKIKSNLCYLFVKFHTASLKVLNALVYRFQNVSDDTDVPLLYRKLG